MKVTDLPLEQLKEAPWNPNQMAEAMLSRLRESLTRYGVVQYLVVRALSNGSYEVLSGNQRLQVLRELRRSPVPCVVVDLDDAQAKLLSQALNRIAGEDDLGLRAEMLKEVLEQVPQVEVLRLLPETAESLQAFASLGQQDLAGYLQNYQQAQVARLRHLTFQSTPAQLEVIEEALARVLPRARGAQHRQPQPKGQRSVPTLQDLPGADRERSMSSSPGVPCIVCGNSLVLRSARGRKSGKPFLMLICPQDGRHFRGFINDQDYVKQVLSKLEARP